MKKLILRTKVKNAILKLNPNANYEFSLDNVPHINGNKERGYCFGRIRNNDNGEVIYLNTEPSCREGLQFLFRKAKDFKDFSSLCYCNHYADTFDEFVERVNFALQTKQYFSSDEVDLENLVQYAS